VWDSTSQRLYVAPYFADGPFYSYDPSTSTTTPLPSIPDGLVSTAFCEDRSGPIYAAGNWQYNQMWQYTIATATWTQVAESPFYNQMTAACTVAVTPRAGVVPVAIPACVRHVAGTLTPRLSR